MMPRAEQLLQDALGLPESERGDLAAKLIDSLDPTADEGAEDAWGAEIQQRLEELRAGRVQPVLWPEARRQILEDTDDSSED